MSVFINSVYRKMKEALAKKKKKSITRKIQFYFVRIGFTIALSPFEISVIFPMPSFRNLVLYRTVYFTVVTLHYTAYTINIRYFHSRLQFETADDDNFIGVQSNIEDVLLLLGTLSGLSQLEGVRT